MKFLRQNWFRLKRLGLKWRKPRGSQSKTRKQKAGKPAMPKIGYKKPESQRGLINGKRPKLIRSIREIGDSKYIIIASTIGAKKLIEIYKYCKEHGIYVVNHKKFSKALEKLRGEKNESKKPEKPVKQDTQSGKE